MMMLHTNWHNCLLKQGLRLSRYPSLTLETHGLILAVRNDSIPFDHNPTEFKLQFNAGRQKKLNSNIGTNVRNTDCTFLITSN